MSLPKITFKSSHQKATPAQIMRRLFRFKDDSEIEDREVQLSLHRDDQPQLPATLPVQSSPQPVRGRSLSSSRNQPFKKANLKLESQNFQLALKESRTTTKRDWLNKAQEAKGARRFAELYKAKQIVKEDKEETSPVEHLIAQINRLSVLPRKLTLVGGAKSNCLNLSKMGLGMPDHLKLIAKFLSPVKNLDSLDLSFNGIQDDCAELIIPFIGQVKKVSLRGNQLGPLCASLLGKLFRHSICKLQQLSLEQNQLGDESAAAIVKGVAEYDNLRLLNLNNCGVGLKTAHELKNLLLQSNSMEQLYISWNRMGGVQATPVVQGAASSQVLRVLDLSWNSLGGHQPCLTALLKLFGENKTLYHLDLSYCDFQYPECHSMAKVLADNHTLFGLHLEGNAAYTNYRGDVILIQNHLVSYPLPSMQLPRILGVQPSPFNRALLIGSHSVCWICDSWQEHVVNASKDDAPKQCFVNLEHEGFKFVRLTDTGAGYSLHRMGPPKMRGFFTKAFNRYFLSQQYQRSPLKFPLNSVTVGRQEITPKLTELNLIQKEVKEPLFDDRFIPLLLCRPRTLELQQKPKVEIVKRKKQKPARVFDLDFPPFNKQNSAFRGWRQPTDQLLRKCLQFDLSCNKVQKIYSKTEPKLFQLLLQNYRHFYKINYMLASRHTENNNFHISVQVMKQFTAQCRYISQKMTPAKVYIKYKSAVSKSGNPEEDDLRDMHRPFFLEFLLRLADQKFCKKNFLAQIREVKEKRSLVQLQKDEDEEKPKLLKLREAYTKVVSRFANIVNENDPHIWRKEKLWTSVMSALLDRYDPFLQQVYLKYCNKRLRVGQQGLLLSEFRLLLWEGQLCDRKDLTLMKEFETYFLISMMLQEEDNNVRNPSLCYIEYVEALCRVAQRISLVYKATPLQGLTPYQKSRTPLFFKTEALIAQLYDYNPEFKSRRTKNYIRSRLFDDVFLRVYCDCFKGPAHVLDRVKINSMGESDSVPSLEQIMVPYKEEMRKLDQQNEEFEEVVVQ